MTKMFVRRFALILLFVVGCRGTERAVHVAPRVELQASGTAALLIGLDVVSDRVVWTAGTNGHFARTTDGGATWHGGVVPGADTVQFRDVHAVDARTAYLMSIGPGAASRIYRTEDAGTSWRLVFQSELEEAFYDCFDFWPDGGGMAFSDAVDGSFPLARSDDGAAWTVIPESERPRGQEGEGGFAASGTCLVTRGDSTAWIGTGNAGVARVLRTADRGRSWSASDTPLAGGEAAGITTLAFRDAQRGLALGGDLTRPDAMQQTAAITDDGGRTWRSASGPGFPGAVYGAAYVPGANIYVAVGPGGAAYATEAEMSWARLDSLSYWSVDAAGPEAVWAVGPEGRIARFRFTGP